MLPVLTVQPIVENAVYHGLLKRGTGGTVKILTEETDDSFLITVTDNGVGFDMFQPPENEKRGMKNEKKEESFTFFTILF